MSKTKKLKYKFPIGESAAGKYIIAFIDADNTVSEIDETNNIVFYGQIAGGEGTTIADYFPLGQGDTWTYIQEDAELTTKTVSGTVVPVGSTYTGTTTLTDTDCTGESSTSPVSYEFRIEGIEDVTVPAGTFTTCLQLKGNFTINLFVIL